jgi:hypothetical protein
VTSCSRSRSSTWGWSTSCDGADGQPRDEAVAAVVAVVVAAAVVAGRRQTEMSAVGELQLRQLLLTVGLTGAKLLPAIEKLRFKDATITLMCQLPKKPRRMLGFLLSFLMTTFLNKLEALTLSIKRGLRKMCICGATVCYADIQ